MASTLQVRHVQGLSGQMDWWAIFAICGGQIATKLLQRPLSPRVAMCFVGLDELWMTLC